MPTIDTVSALLVKAERTENSHEAEAYLAKAQELATLHAIDLAAAASRQVAERGRRFLSSGQSRSASRASGPIPPDLAVLRHLRLPTMW